MTLVHTPPRWRPTVRRGLATLAAAAVAASMLAGCSSASSTSGSKTLTFLSWDNATVMKPIVADFEKANPGYTVNISYAPPVAQYIQKLQTQLGSNSAPDVFIITAENKQKIMAGKLARDLTGESFTSNLGTAEKATYTKDGKLYGSAISSWGGGLLVNKEVLAKAGITSFPTTWSGFLEMSKKLKAAGIEPYIEPGDGISITLAALIGLQNQKYGGTMDQQIWNGKLTFKTAWTPAVQAWYQLFSEGIVPTSIAGLTFDQVTQEFEQGKVAMIGTGSWGLASIKTAAPNLNLEFHAVPGTGSQPYWAGAVSPGLAVNAKAKDPEAALKFVQYMQSVRGVTLYQKETEAITTTKDFTPTLDPALSSMTTAVRKGDFYLPAVSWINNNDALGTQATALLQQTIAGQITPAQFAEGMDSKLSSLGK